MFDLIQKEAERAELHLDSRLLDRLYSYTELLTRWGQRINLTGKAEPGQIIQRHLPDAFFLTAGLASIGVCCSAIDVGSGAGLPGLILALLRPDIRLTLVEPTMRKCSFLRTASYELDVPVCILQQRIESVQIVPQDLACSRATWPPEEWLRRAGALVHAKGKIVAFYSSTTKAPVPPAGLDLIRELPYTLSDGTPRCIMFYQASTISNE